MSSSNGEVVPNMAQPTINNYEQLYKWIDSHEISRAKKNLNRDFSDAVAMAELLKAHYPKFVELHNYAPRNSLMRKLDNWNTLNRKVLTKVGLKMTTAEIESCAKGIPGAVEQLLERVKRRVEQKQNNNQEAICPGVVLSGGVGPDGQHMVSADLLDKQQLELDIKNEAIEMLGEKVKHLQNLLQLKDQRIEELTAKLDECINQQQTTNSSFFKIFQ